MSLNTESSRLKPKAESPKRVMRLKQTVRDHARDVFYLLKPIIPRSTQIWVRRQMMLKSLERYADVWPILERAKTPPAGWPGWPDGKKFAVVLKHDVEHMAGQLRCQRLMEIEKSLGFRSSFNFVPERYQVPPELRQLLADNGFEVGVHGLNHDGKLFRSRQEFEARAKKINQYMADWGAVGFFAPASHHNLEWMHQINMVYDSSTFDTDPFEPQPDPIETIFPFWVAHENGRDGYMELPYTLVQDFTLFILMQAQNTEIWQKKLAWIAQQGGMVMLNTHPDYICFDGEPTSIQEYAVQHYIDFLTHIKTNYEGQYWHALPREVAAYLKPKH